MLLSGQPLMTLVVIAGGGVAGLMLAPSSAGQPPAKTEARGGRAFVFISIALGLLVLLPVLGRIAPSPLLDLADGFYRSGMLVFGGGHVVLPLLEAEMVDPGLISAESFLAGYGAAQAIPGPLFTIAAFLGQATGIGLYGITGAVVALVMIFLGSFLLLLGVLPWWDRLRSFTRVRQCLDGVNAAVVGLLAAVLINPIMMSAITTPVDAALALGGFALLWRGWLSPLPVVGLIVITTMILAGLDIGPA